MAPTLKKFTLSDRDKYNSFVKNFPTHSDMNFNSVFIWDIYDQNSFDIIDNNKTLIVCIADYHTNEKLFCLITHFDIQQKIMKALEWLAWSGEISPKLSFIPDYMIHKLKGIDSLHAQEDPDNFDYLISVRKLAELKANEFKAKSYLSKKFLSQYSSAYAELDLNNADIKDEVITCFRRWQTVRKKSGKDVEDEFSALSRALKYSKELSLNCCGIYVNDELISFIIYEIEQNQRVCIFHFEKTDTTFIGASENIKQSLAKNLLINGVEIINYEQDLGIDGLRKAKMLYHPVGFRKKYTVKLN